MRRQRLSSFLFISYIFKNINFHSGTSKLLVKNKKMAATQRLSSVLAHINPPSSQEGGRAKLLQKNPDDIVRPFPSFYYNSLQKTNDKQVITYAARTPLTKAKKGALKDTPIDDLLIALLTVRLFLTHPFDPTNKARLSVRNRTSTPPWSKMSVSGTCSPQAKGTLHALQFSQPATPSPPPPA